MSRRTGPAVALRKARANFASPADFWLFFQVFVLVTLLPVLLRFLSIPELLRFLTPRKPKDPLKVSSNVSSDKLVKYIDFILGRNVWLYRPNCLRRSLVLYHFLRQHGIAVQLYLGARFTQATQAEQLATKLDGHAWLVYQGRPFQERNPNLVRNYQVTYSYPTLSAVAGSEGQ